MGLYNSPKIVTKDIVWHMDFANKRCYSGSGNDTYSLINFKSGTIDGPEYDDKNGCFDFTNANQDNILITSFGNLISDYCNGTSSNFTFNVWFTTDVIPASTSHTVSPMVINGSGKFNIYLLLGDGQQGSQFNVRCYQGGGWKNMGVTPVGSIVTGTWYNYSVTYNTSSGWKGYLNGIVLADDGDDSQTGAIMSNSLPGPYIGCQIDSLGSYYPGRFWDGKIAITSLYSRDLTAAEVKQNYDTLKPRFGL